MLFDCYLVAKGSMAFELEKCGGMNTCTTPPTPHPLDTFHLVSVCSTQREAKKKRAAQRRKESIPEISPKLSVWGQGSKVDQWGGMSGVKWSRQGNVGLVKCFPVNLWPGGNTKHQVLLQDYPNRMEIRGEILTWWSVIRNINLRTELTLLADWQKVNPKPCRFSLSLSPSLLWYKSKGTN